MVTQEERKRISRNGNGRTWRKAKNMQYQPEMKNRKNATHPYMALMLQMSSVPQSISALEFSNAENGGKHGKVFNFSNAESFLTRFSGSPPDLFSV